MNCWQKGCQLNNEQYTVENFLGINGFTVSYLIKENKSDRLFILKTLPPQLKNNSNFEQLQSKFINQAIALTSCSHPHLVRVHPQGFIKDGLWCTLMEYVEGKSLANYVNNQGNLAEKEALKIITKVAEGLSLVHQQGFYHLDIHPDNILLRDDSNPLLVGFGLNRECLLGKAIANCKTLFFVAPEQFQSTNKGNPQIDIYALAATLYFLLTGQLPTPALFRQKAKLISPQELNSKISDRLNYAIIKGMETEKSDRPNSLVEWLSLLTSYQEMLNSSKGFLESNYKIANNDSLKFIFEPTQRFVNGYGIIIFEAKEVKSNTSVLIKTSGEYYNSIYRKAVEDIAQLKNEAKLLKKLNQYNHPNIIRYRDSFEEKGNLFLVLNKNDGKTLHNIIDDRGKLSEKKAIKYIKQIASALIICHENNIYYRDIAPLNIIIETKSDLAILTDFKVAANPELVGNGLYLPDCRSKSEDNKINELTDVFSLAAILYLLVTGKKPSSYLSIYVSEESSESLRTGNSWYDKNEKLIEPKQFNSDLSNRLNYAIIKGMEIEKSDRPQSVVEWLELLTLKENKVEERNKGDRTDLLNGRYRIIENLEDSSSFRLNNFLAKDILNDGVYHRILKFDRHSNGRFAHFNNRFSLKEWKETFNYLFNRFVNNKKQLQHSQIPQLLEYFEENNTFYFVYEHIEGNPLTAELTEDKPWQELEVIDFLIEVLEILAYIQERKIIHGFIKPSNLIRNSKDNRIYLTEFIDTDLIRWQYNNCNDPYDASEFPIVIYPNSYSSFGEFFGRPYPNIDFYNLGTIAIEALTGKVSNKLSNENSVCSPELAAILQKMVEFEPQNRYQSALEVLQDLETIKKAKRKEYIKQEKERIRNHKDNIEYDVIFKEVDDRALVLALDYLYRQDMKVFEVQKLLTASKVLIDALKVSVTEVPIEGYYNETEELKEYFLNVRALQKIEADKIPVVNNLNEYQLLLEVTSSKIFGTESESRKFLPARKDPLFFALEEAKGWNAKTLTEQAYNFTLINDEFSLVGIASYIKDPVVLTALRESVVLYAAVYATGAFAIEFKPSKTVYLWNVDRNLENKVNRFINTFNELTSSNIKPARADNAEYFYRAFDKNEIEGRCVKIAVEQDSPFSPPSYYHWAIKRHRGKLVVDEFWDRDLWTTERYRRERLYS